MSDEIQTNLNQEPERTPPHPRGPRGGGWLGKATFACSVLALLASAAALYLTLTGERASEPEPPPEPITFSYRDRTLEALEGVPVNEYVRGGFSLDGEGRLGYQQEGRQAKMGIDVSIYQKEIDWAAVAADGVEFVMIRLGYRGYTQGGLQMDSCFEANIQGALAEGLEVGVYFFSQAVTPQEAEEEADFVLRAIQGYDVTYPVAFDWEFITPGKGARTDGMDGETLTQCAKAFCERVAQAGYTPQIYFNQDVGYLSYDLSQLSQYSFWLAEYDSAPDFYYHFDLWQYTHKGRVEGIQTDVDWNLDLRPVRAREAGTA